MTISGIVTILLAESAAFGGVESIVRSRLCHRALRVVMRDWLNQCVTIVSELRSSARKPAGGSPVGQWILLVGR